MSEPKKIFPSARVREIDAYTIANEPIASIDLMERASLVMYDNLVRRFDQSVPFVVVAGPGNNGGDALALARMLAGDHYRVSVLLLRLSDRLSDDAATNLERLKQQGRVDVSEIRKLEDLPGISREAVILDGIFGSGLTRPASGFVAGVIMKINSLPNRVIAIDIPSGLFGEDNTGNQTDHIIKADQTLSLQFPSLSFFFAENHSFTGQWEVLDIGLHPEAIRSTGTDYHMLDAAFVASMLRQRPKFSHKGTYGHVLLIAGSYGMMGAAVLGAEAGLRSGAGLLTVHVPRYGYKIIQTAIPEALISIDRSDIICTEFPDLSGFSAVAVGPGTGTRQNTLKALLELIREVKAPLLIDADGLNLLGRHKEGLSELPPLTILTPHPKEFERLAGPSRSGYEQVRKQVEFSAEYGVIVVLKGAHTSVSLPDGRCFFNTTGNSGMATGGSGDVLTGIILSLLGQAYPPAEACLAGVYLHGLAGDLAVRNGSEEALIARDITAHIGQAYRNIKDRNIKE